MGGSEGNRARPDRDDGSSHRGSFIADETGFREVLHAAVGRGGKRSFVVVAILTQTGYRFGTFVLATKHVKSGNPVLQGRRVRGKPNKAKAIRMSKTGDICGTPMFVMQARHALNLFPLPPATSPCSKRSNRL